MARKPPEPPSRETAPARARGAAADPPRPDSRPKLRLHDGVGRARNQPRIPRLPAPNGCESAPEARVRAAQGQPGSAPRGTSGRGRQAGAAELTAQMQQILDELGELRGIKSAVQALSAKLDAVLRQVGAPGERDPGDAVPPGVAVQSPAPLSAEDQAVLEKLENEGPEATDTEPRTSD